MCLSVHTCHTHVETHITSPVLGIAEDKAKDRKMDALLPVFSETLPSASWNLLDVFVIRTSLKYLFTYLFSPPQIFEANTWKTEKGFRSSHIPCPTAVNGLRLIGQIEIKQVYA